MKSVTTSAPSLKRPHCEMRSAFVPRHPGVASLLVRCAAVSKPNQPRNHHILCPDTWHALCRTLYRLVITVCLVLTSLGCTRTAEKFCGADRETLKQKLIRLVESPVIKADDWVNATSITMIASNHCLSATARPRFRSSFAGPPVLSMLAPTIPETVKPTCKRRKMDIVT
jgi:hypothetical protein